MQIPAILILQSVWNAKYFAAQTLYGISMEEICTSVYALTKDCAM